MTLPDEPKTPTDPLPVSLTDEQLESLARHIASALPTFLIYRDPPVVFPGTTPMPEPPTEIVDFVPMTGELPPTI